ncbi:hypothetical protein [Demequina lutea]|uniref:Phage shock protein B n=1 Tax=Demequina lutea TaxID=431489 RepID=A0A7Z0CJA8_9MICO|nr:hypothetical protein [Demequina lutea]NYI40560.1 hypothetical protein [Demequina lutea]
MDSIPWFGWIAIVGTAGWAVMGSLRVLTSPRARAQTNLTDALRASADANTKMAERLDAIDTRLATIEKTLTDIP